MKSFAQRLVLKQRHKVTQKRPIQFIVILCSITVRVQRLLMLLPTDPDVQEALDSIGQQVIACYADAP